MANKHMKRRSTSLTTRERQIKAMMRYQYLNKIANFFFLSNNTKAAVEAEKIDFFYTDDGNVKWYNYSGK